MKCHLYVGLLVTVLCLLPLRLKAEDSIPAVNGEQEVYTVQMDRPGVGTGTNVLEFGKIQWESGFEYTRFLGNHILTLPTTLFRFGLHRRAELRLEYAGELYLFDMDGDEENDFKPAYTPEPLFLGTKIMLWEGSEEKRLRWVPRVSLMLNLGLPLTPDYAKYMPVSGKIDALFENDITSWFSIGYDFGAHWNEWAPMPDFMASLALNFSPIDRLGLFVESYNYFNCDVNAKLLGYSTAYSLYLDFGVTYMPHPHVQLDVYAGFNYYETEKVLGGPENFAFVGIGVAWLVWDEARFRAARLRRQ